MRKTINSIIKAMNMTLLCVLFLSVLWSTLARLVGAPPPLWAESIALVIIIWLGIVSSSYSIVNDDELKLGLLDRYFSKKTIVFLEESFQMLTIGFAGYMMWYGIKLIMLADKVALGGTDLSNIWMYISIPVCGILILMNIGKEK